ncbi:MAG: translation initiation factor IF-2 subunit alpha [Ignisphaera sp.]|uniref:Translation initiation factor IF-2 subunit alpha n=1 Tax=Ignisphaera aggregans TaxID=334771 RepID=A0A7C4JJP6_9CREN
MSALPFRKKSLPEVSELVIARVDKVFEYGAYCTLLEYEISNAFIPWSEVSAKYVKDIRDVLKEGQVVIAKVIRVDRKASRVQVDLSIKRVLEGEKKVKMLRWKRMQKAQKIVELTAKNLGKSLEEAYKNVWSKLEKIVDPLSVFEDSILVGVEPLIKLGISEEWGKALYDEAKKHISIKMVKIRSILKITTYKPDGVERIKKVLSHIQNMPTPLNTKISVYTIGSPRYRIEIMSPNYKDAESIFNQIETELQRLVRELEIEHVDLVREEVEKGG